MMKQPLLYSLRPEHVRRDEKTLRQRVAIIAVAPVSRRDLRSNKFGRILLDFIIFSWIGTEGFELLTVGC